jgi:putative nucleotidyltransferase with HDIG domain
MGMLETRLDVDAPAQAPILDENKVRVLVVDDEPVITDLLSDFLNLRGRSIRCTNDAREGLSLFQSFRPQVCILDLQMPHVKGPKLFESMKHVDPRVEVIFLTGAQEVRTAIDLMKMGAADYLLKPVDLGQLDISISHAFEHRRLLQENEAYKTQLELLVARKTRELDLSLQRQLRLHAATLETLGMALDYRDRSTFGHSRRVADLTAGVAREINIGGSELVQIEQGALLHDIGKLRIPDSILLKPQELTPEEWAIMRRHAEYGYEFLEKIDFLRDAAEIVYAHHEQFDGSGYPRGLKEEAIPLGARLFAIVDAVDAMVCYRPYHEAVSFVEAASQIRSSAACHFDPALIDPALDYLARHLQSDPR